MDTTQHYLTEPYILQINETGENLEELPLAETDILGTNNDNPTELRVDDYFENWDVVQTKVDTYAKSHGFVACKCRKDLDPTDKSIVRRRVFKCWKFGINKPRKVENIDVHRDSTSGKTDC